MSDRHFRVYGMSQSYFTRKIEGYLAYKQIPYLLRRFGGGLPEARAAGWPGGIPVVKTPEGDFIWDTTDMIHYLERLYPEPSVLPDDPALRFACYALEDVLDEWFYRPAVGSRWFYDENTAHGGWELARAITHEMPIAARQAHEMVEDFVRATCEPFGVTGENVGTWIDEVLRPFMRVLGTHLDAIPYLLGGRPSLADFALFGGCAAHFANDPVCRTWLDADAPPVVKHTHRLVEPEDQVFESWLAPGEVPETLIEVLADLGRLYLPWVSRAVSDGSAELRFGSGQRIELEPSPFLVNARRVLLARYRELRCDAVDSMLERAGILGWYRDFVDDAGEIPDASRLPQPDLNRPFGPPAEPSFVGVS